ncbi:MAG: UbiD family decarboxylase [Bacteroidetes bacterium]|nr:UbiD family decarboxylase [Bacteroidota bacterium]MBV6460855.1 4-hydroxybenzoate decarboxylase subunit C [Flavobacteriales bacterium]WKZ75854.1 MAG: UbiD family decarboxylase [Vicingaceae bacterium]MCL4816599.1 UbiD family decarboxylase [Flavobacteriales bacterium]NOG95644.1 UbiD family decarboxylase [Bacteroidota bacterium]
MKYKNLAHCLSDLEKNGHLIRVKEEVSPSLEMASIHLRVFSKKGQAILFENIKGCKYKAVSNLFGTEERCQFIFRHTYQKVQHVIEVKNNPIKALKYPFKNFSVFLSLLKSLPKKVSFSSAQFEEISISDLPQIKSWKQDGGAFITLPQVYSEDIENPGILHSNLGMYRIQLSGNNYIPNKEIGLHYQLHRGIGIHQQKANSKNAPLKVSIFVGGPPAHTLAAVMPLPEGISEIMFAGILANRRFRYALKDGYTISCDADFVITGEVYPNEVKPEGPFGDHLGYYSLTHNFPVLRVYKVYAKKNAIWPFTIVGRPPQEDTFFGKLIHQLTGRAIQKEIPGLHEVHAVDAAGVHPLLLVIGSERYTPYLKEIKPAEILTIANHILGTGQLSLAKYLFIAAKEDNPTLNTKNIEAFFKHILERIDWSEDLHFLTNTTIDTLDYSSEKLNQGSKLILAAAGKVKRTLGSDLSVFNTLPALFNQCKLVMPGVVAISAPEYTLQTNVESEIKDLLQFLENVSCLNFPLLVLCNDAEFVSYSLNNFLWVTFTRSNPSHDIYGVKSFYKNKHWGCLGNLIIDARIKPHHAPPLKLDEEIENKTSQLSKQGGSLYGII